MINLIWIIPGYIAAGFLLAIIARADTDDAPWIILFWPLFVALCIIAGVIEGIRAVYKMVEDMRNGNTQK